MSVKAISLWQPYASAIALGLKTHETRHWPTSQRGTVAIHAAKRVHREQRTFFENACLTTEPWKSAFHAARLYSYSMLPKGCVVAVANLVDCIPSERFFGKDMLPLTASNGLLGDYSAGRWIWVLENIRPLPQPYGVTGRQGWFDVSDRILDMKPMPEGVMEGFC